MKPSSSVRLEWEGKRSPGFTGGQLRHEAEVYPAGAAALPEPVNHLIQGDNLVAMAALLPAWEGRVRLIYADPPFGTGKGFTRRTGHGEDSRRPADWQRGEGYSDAWPSPEAYLAHLYPRLQLMRRLLADDGTFYLHLDWRAVAYGRLLLDEIFGRDQFLNEVIWVYHGPSPVRSYFNRKHDTLLVYRKGKRHLFRADRVRVPYDPSTRRTFASSTRAGFGRVPDLDRGKVPEDWWYFPVVARLHSERTGYPTQKPEALLERILLASSDPGDWVADFYCGSGTTLRVAARLGRAWVGVDCAPQAIQVCLRRLVLAACEPFLLEEAVPAGEEQRAVSPPGEVQAQAELAGRTLTLRLAGMPVCGPQGFPTSLDYWEVDFDFHPPVFRSRAQAPRPWRAGDAALELTYTYEQAGEHRVRVRAYSADGDAATADFSLEIGEN